MNRQSLKKLHRWVGLLFSLTILTSSGSGVLHTIMSRTQAPPPPAARPANDGLSIAAVKVAVPDAVAALSDPDKPVRMVNLRGIHGEPWYQLYRSGVSKPEYVSALTGVPDPAQDERYAAEIATNFLGGAPVEKTDYLTTYNSEYIAIFRILPVYRFDSNDGLGTRLYVSTMTGSVTRHTDEKRQLEANVFSLLHKFMFIRNKDLRDAALVVVTGGAFLVSCMGLALFFATRPRRQPRPEGET